MGISVTYWQVWKAGINNYITQYLCDVITCLFPSYLPLAQHSWFHYSDKLNLWRRHPWMIDCIPSLYVGVITDMCQRWFSWFRSVKQMKSKYIFPLYISRACPMRAINLWQVIHLSLIKCHYTISLSLPDNYFVNSAQGENRLKACYHSIAARRIVDSTVIFQSQKVKRPKAKDEMKVMPYDIWK